MKDPKHFKIYNNQKRRRKLSSRVNKIHYESILNMIKMSNSKIMQLERKSRLKLTPWKK